jgi:hypothetical protein
MNSAYAKHWMAGRRRSKMHIYPDDWKELPIAVLPVAEQEEFVRLVDAILSEFMQHGHPLPPSSAARVAQLEHEIEDRVKKVYNC